VSEGARFAAVNQNPGEKEKLSLMEWLRAQGDNNHVKEATASICSPTSAVGDWVEVKFTRMYKWEPLTAVIALFGSKSSSETPITSTGRMRIEVPPASPYPAKC
jgi:hypothetical protein